MESQAHKFRAAQAKAEEAAHEIQKQMTAAYRQGYLDGLSGERQLMTDDLLNMLSSISQNCETSARNQEFELHAERRQIISEVTANDDEQEARPFSKSAARFAPEKDTNVADIQDGADQPRETATNR